MHREDSRDFFRFTVIDKSLSFGVYYNLYSQTRKIDESLPKRITHNFDNFNRELHETCPMSRQSLTPYRPSLILRYCPTRTIGLDWLLQWIATGYIFHLFHRFLMSRSVSHRGWGYFLVIFFYLIWWVTQQFPFTELWTGSLLTTLSRSEKRDTVSLKLIEKFTKLYFYRSCIQ